MDYKSDLAVYLLFLRVFNIKIEFNHDKFRQMIANAICRNIRGYVCIVDANVLAMTLKDEDYCRIVRESYVNSCDGSSIAAMVNHIYGTHYRAFNGPDIFEEYIEKTDYKQLLLGKTEAMFNRIMEELGKRNKSTGHLSYMPLPFAAVEAFDYQRIAGEINKLSPDVIWVSLGAPKQERFMERLLPYLNKGLMFGIGAAFSFYVGDNVQPRFHLGSIRFIWLDRIFREPKKQLRRIFNIIQVYPQIYRAEYIRKKHADSDYRH